MQESWHQILTQLTGVRLAIYDELIRQDKLPAAMIARYTPPVCDQAIDWLEARRLITRADDGRLSARDPHHARELYESHGAAVKALPAPKPQPPRTATPRPAPAQPERRAVHTHQTRLFDL